LRAEGKACRPPVHRNPQERLMSDREKTAVSLPTETDGSVPFGGARAAADVLLRPGQPLFYRIPEVMTLLAMSKSDMFDQLRRGRLDSVRKGRARRIPVGAILDYIGLLEREHAEEVAQ
jgi:hypothetical protein